LGLILVGCLLVLLVLAPPAAAPSAAGEALKQRGAKRLPPHLQARRPNVLVIVTDDQPPGMVRSDVMPLVDRWFVRRGRSYPGFVVADPLCCPSRASIMTGRYDHNNRVLGNGRFALRLDQRTTIQCYLQHAGYLTGMFGKFFNGWPLARRPSCFDGFAITGGSRHHLGVPFNIDGRMTDVRGWADDKSTSRAVGFLRRSERHDRRPWYLYLATTAPHSPFVPKARYAESPIPRWRPDPAVRERDLSDKPPEYRDHLVVRVDARRIRDAQLRLLMGVDQEVGRLIGSLSARGEVRRTLMVFVSDNGFLLGQHGLAGKRFPYTDSVRVPMFLSWQGHIPPGSVDDRQAENVDLVPTILGATGVRPRLRHPLDGRNLLDGRWQRRYQLLEHWQLPRRSWQPTWFSLRTPGFQYVEYHAHLPPGHHRHDVGPVTFREYYDLVRDPYELHNLLGNSTGRDDPPVRRLRRLHRRLERARLCEGRRCP
jgi:arylsulfatase A-like enzyme